MGETTQRVRSTDHDVSAASGKEDLSDVAHRPVLRVDHQIADVVPASRPTAHPRSSPASTSPRRDHGHAIGCGTRASRQMRSMVTNSAGCHVRQLLFVDDLVGTPVRSQPCPTGHSLSTSSLAELDQVSPPSSVS